MAEPAKNYQASVHSIAGGLDKQYNAQPLNTGGSGGTFDDMTERLAKLEGQFEGHKLVQTITISIVGVVAVVLVSSVFFLMSQVGQLPTKISSDLRDLNQTLLQAVTASKQAPPQVILLPAPERPTLAPPDAPKQ